MRSWIMGAVATFLVSGTLVNMAFGVCTEELAGTRIVPLDGSERHARCTEACRVLEAERLPRDGGKTETAHEASGGAAIFASQAERRPVRFDLGAAPRGWIWLRYRTNHATALPVILQAAGAPQQPGSLPVSTLFRWEPLAGRDGRPLTFSSAIGGATLTTLLGANDAVDCIVLLGEDMPTPGVREVIEIDDVWAGTRVDFDAVGAGDVVFAGYYDVERWLTVARIDLRSGRIERRRLDARFGGWDSHLTVQLALDGQGGLHIAANMHASPLTYFRASDRDNLQGLARSTMVGSDERRVTYPTFLSLADGLLVFLYRDGVSGDGAWFANLLEGGRWQRKLARPLFADRDIEGPVSAYPTAFVPFPDGTLRVAVMWRRPGDVAHNFRITHHVTRDLVTWVNAARRPDKLPLGPTSGDQVDDPGIYAGLINTHHLVADQRGRPVVSYTKYGPDGRNAAVLRVLDSGVWREQIVASATRRQEIRNATVERIGPGVGAVRFATDRTALVEAGFPGLPGRLRVELDPDDLAPRGTPEVIQLALSRLALGAPDPGLATPSLTLRPVRGLSGEEWLLVWVTQGIFGDRPRPCTEAEPHACAPPPTRLRLLAPR